MSQNIAKDKLSRAILSPMSCQIDGTIMKKAFVDFLNLIVKLILKELSIRSVCFISKAPDDRRRYPVLIWTTVEMAQRTLSKQALFHHTVPPTLSVIPSGCCACICISSTCKFTASMVAFEREARGHQHRNPKPGNVSSPSTSGNLDRDLCRCVGRCVNYYLQKCQPVSKHFSRIFTVKIICSPRWV